MSTQAFSSMGLHQYWLFEQLLHCTISLLVDEITCCIHCVDECQDIVRYLPGCCHLLLREVALIDLDLPSF